MISLDWAIIGLRFIQFGGAMILFGSSLFLLFGKLLPIDAKPAELTWAKSLIIAASFALLLATPLQFVIQTANLAGSFAGILQDDALSSALFGMSFGISSIVRGILAFVALLLAVLLPSGRRLFGLMALLGAIICASFAWMGHGAATEGGAGWLHLSGDIAHSLAAAGWLGALAIFWIASCDNAPPVIEAARLVTSLASFAGLGTFLVTIILASGLTNSAFLVGWDIPKALSTPYGQLLTLKLALFVAMLWLAARNRFRHTPMLTRALDSEADLATSLADLRRSIRLETLSGVAILILVAWLGTLPPATAQ
jgi:putative copper resistance protein D